jgi:hypothetical protein
MHIILNDKYADGRLEVANYFGSQTVTIKLNGFIFQTDLSEWQKLCSAFTPANQKVNEDE